MQDEMKGVRLALALERTADDPRGINRCNAFLQTPVPFGTLSIDQCNDLACEFIVSFLPITGDRDGVLRLLSLMATPISHGRLQVVSIVTFPCQSKAQSAS